MWDKFRHICGSRRLELVLALSKDGSLVTDSAQKADFLLSGFFPEASAVSQENDPEPAVARNPLSPDTMITLEEVMDAIFAARRTAPGRDEIPVICWQECSVALAPILLGLYNACLQ